MKETTATIAQNTKVLLISQVITWTSSFVLMLFLPRYLGPVEYGVLYYAISVCGLAVLLMDLGFTTMFVKEIARDRIALSSLLTNGAILRLIVWPLSLILAVGYVVIEGSSAQTIYLVLALGIANLFFGLYDLIHRAFIGLEQMQYRSMALIVEKGFLAIAGVAVLLLGQKSVAIAIVMLLSMALNLLISHYFLKKTGDVRFVLEPHKWRPMVRRGLPFMFSMMISFIYFRIDVLMLKSMTNEAVVGWYGAPYRLFDTLMFFPNILNTAVFPVLSRFVQSSREHVDHTARWILNLTLFVAIPVAVLLVVLADSIIPLIFGAQYHNSVVLLQILSVSLLLIYVDFVFNTVLVSHDMQRKIVVVSAIATVVNIGVNLFLIRYFQEHHGNGAIGAAIATAITEASVMAMFMYLLPKGVFGHENIIVLAKTIACGVVMWGAIWLVQQSAIGWVFSAIVGVAVYLLMLFSLRAISQHEWQFIASLLSFRKQATVTISN